MSTGGPPNMGDIPLEEEVVEEVVPTEMVTLGNTNEIERAAIDSQVATARRFPRSITKSLQEAEGLATLDEETAASCFYSLPRGGKRIEGPSARLAEIMLYAWGNVRGDADVVGVDGNYITAVGTCFDLEKNTAVRVRVRRRITNSKGKRYDDDMIVVTGNAAVSIALRNAVFRVIPSAFVKRIYLKAREASIGKGGTLTQKRQNAMDWFNKTGLSNDDVFALLDVKGLDDIGSEELIALRGLRTAIADGDTSVEEIVRDLHGGADGSASVKGMEGLKARLAEKQQKKDGAPAGKRQTPPEGTQQPEEAVVEEGGQEQAEEGQAEVTSRRGEIRASLEGQTQAQLHKSVTVAGRKAGVTNINVLNPIVKRVLGFDSYQEIKTAEEAASLILVLEQETKPE